MTEKDAYYKSLLQRYLNGSCSDEELQEIMDFLASDTSNRALLEALQKEFDSASAADESSISASQSLRIFEALDKKIPRPLKMLPARRRSFFVAAASLLLVISTGIYLNRQRNSGHVNTKSIDDFSARYHNDVRPGSNKATLTLSDGSTIVLDDSKNGVLASQGNTKIIKLNNKVSYNTAKGDPNQPVYNTITTPRGGQYEIELPDGSHVWLNASSSLKFPASFAAAVRSVSVTGEAYFEVKHDASRPFVVFVNNSEIKVLGTHFNVMAYEEEKTVNTTLLQGKVVFKNGGDSSLLKPGQQSKLAGGRLSVLNNVDTENVMAWKNGFMHFQNADLQSVMRQLSRWYDVDVEYRNNNFKHEFVGDLPRSLTLSNVLKALEVTGNIKFGIEGRKIIVLPENN